MVDMELCVGMTRETLAREDTRYANAHVKRVLVSETRIQEEARLRQGVEEEKTRDRRRRDGARLGKGAWRG